MSKKLKWGLIFLKDMKRSKLLSNYLQGKVDVEFKEYKVEGELKTILDLAKNEVDFLRVAPEFMDQIQKDISQNYTDIEVLNSLDALFKEEDKHGWWPQNILKDSIQLFLTKKIKLIDVTQPVFLIGSSGLARGVLAGLVKLGFKKINICSPNEDEAQTVINEFQKVLFETQIVLTKKDQRTLLPGVHGVVINTLDFVEENSFLSELYFFNFLKKGGYVIDLSELPVITPFIRIASDIEAKTFVGCEVFAYQDALWLKKAINFDLDIDEYTNYLKSELEKEPVDNEAMKKIFEDFQIK